MADYTTIMAHIDRGRGIAATHLGPPFDVYRVQYNAALNMLDPANLVAEGVPVFRRTRQSSDMIEGTHGKAIIWEVIGDMSPYILGDLFLQQDKVYGVGATIVPFPTQQFICFCLAFHGPVKKSVGVFLNRFVNISRNLSGADTNGYLSGDSNATVPLILVNGQFQLGTAGQTPTNVPVGVDISERWRAELFRDIPASIGQGVRYIYVPPLPGFDFKEGDWLHTSAQPPFGSGAIYRVNTLFEQQTGFVGNLLSVTRNIPQA
jgi:hypothetical protein